MNGLGWSIMMGGKSLEGRQTITGTGRQTREDGQEGPPRRDDDDAPHTIAMFRRRFLKEIEGPFVQVLELPCEMGMWRMGTVALDGTKIDANASRHSALLYEHAGRLPSN